MKNKRHLGPTRFNYDKLFIFLKCKHVSERTFSMISGISRETINRLKNNECVYTSTLDCVIKALDVIEPNIIHSLWDICTYK